MVIAGHFPEVGKAQFPRYAQLFDGPLFAFGWTGVDLFFVLSGFLIGRQLWKEQQRTGTINVGRFIIRRGLRIWPLYFFIALLAPALDNKWSYKWADWVFLSNYFSGRVEGGWSLSTEEQFYLLAPLLIFAGARFLRTRGWLAVLVTLLVAVSGARWWSARTLFAAGDSLATVKTAMYAPFHLHSEGLTIGLLIALVSVIRPQLLDGSSPARLRVLTMAGVASVLAVVLRAANGTVFPFLALGMIYGSATVALLVIGSDTLRLLKAPVFYRVSRLSYGMYLNHFAVLRWIAPSVGRAVKAVGGQNPLSVFVTLGIVVVISVSFSVATFAVIEYPFLALRERVQYTKAKFRGLPARPAPVVAPAGVYLFDRLDDLKENPKRNPRGISDALLRADSAVRGSERSADAPRPNDSDRAERGHLL